MDTPEECGRAVMKAFVKFTECPHPTSTGWAVGELSRSTLRQIVGNDRDADLGIDYAVGRHWIFEKSPDTDVYCPTERAFLECW